MSDLNDYATKLTKISINAKDGRLRYNSICGLKNIIFFSNSNKEIKKSIMKKVSYDTLFSFIDDKDCLIQEQILLILRSLLFKNAEDIDEVCIH